MTSSTVAQDHSDYKFYRNVHVFVDDDVVPRVIGKKGRHFNRIKTSAGVDQLVYNKDRSVVHVYGDNNSLDVAERLLDEHMERLARTFGRTYYEPDVNDAFGVYDLREFDKRHLRHLIGKRGRHFKHITRKSGASYLWYDLDHERVVIYGSEESILSARRALDRTLRYVIQKVVPRFEPTDERSTD